MIFLDVIADGEKLDGVCVIDGMLCLKPESLRGISAGTLGMVMNRWAEHGDWVYAHLVEWHQLEDLPDDAYLYFDSTRGVAMFRKNGPGGNLLNRGPTRPKPAPSLSRPPSSGDIYLLRAENGYYKIGRSKDVVARLQQIEREYPLKIELLHSFAVEDAPSAERFFHDLFQNRRLNKTEWFALTESEVAMFIERGSQHVQAFC